MLNVTWSRSKLLYQASKSLTRLSSKDAKIKIQLMREYKETYGTLLETKKEKIKNLKKLEKEGKKENILAINNCQNDDSELSWMLSHSNVKSLKKIKRKNDTNNVKKLVDKSFKLNDENVDKSNITNTTTVKENNENLLTNNEGVFINKLGISLNDILNFPISSRSKDDTDNWNSNEILKLTPQNSSDYSLPGVTRVLNETMSDQAKLMLARWKEKMIKELGEDGFNRYHQAQLDDSKLMHSLIECTLKKQPVDVPSHIKPSYDSVNLVLKNIDSVRFIESQVVHQGLGYRGFADCVAVYRGNLCLIDWKKSEKAKTLSSSYDSPLQISAYIGALNSDSNYPFQVKRGVLAFAYTKGNPPSVFEFDSAKLEYYWKEWLKRLAKYHMMHSKTV